MIRRTLSLQSKQQPYSPSEIHAARHARNFCKGRAGTRSSVSVIAFLTFLSALLSIAICLSGSLVTPSSGQIPSYPEFRSRTRPTCPLTQMKFKITPSPFLTIYCDHHLTKLSHACKLGRGRGSGCILRWRTWTWHNQCRPPNSIAWSWTTITPF